MCTCHACSYNTRDILIGYITSYGSGFIEGSVDIFGHMDFFYFMHVTMWSETTVTCASRPLVTPDMRSIVGVDLAMFRGADIQATVPLDGDLQG